MTDKSKQGKSNRRKGNAFEREVVKELKRQGLLAIRLGTAGMPEDLGDIGGLTLPHGQGLRVECKNLEHLAKSIQAGLRKIDGKGPAVVIASQRGKPVGKSTVTFLLEDFAKIIALRQIDGSKNKTTLRQ